MKILLVGDSSGFHRTLSEGLERLGHEAVVASDGSTWMQTERDIDISRPDAGKLGGLALWLKMQRLCRTRLRGYDVVSLHRPAFMAIRPERQRGIFDLLRRHNKRVFLSATSTDSYYEEECRDVNSVLRYNEYRLYDRPGSIETTRPQDLEIPGGPMRRLSEHVYGRIDGAVSALYEYDVALRRALPADKVAYGGIPVDTRAIGFSPLEVRGKVRLFLGKKRGQEAYKGTDLLEAAARRVVDRHPGRAELTVVENVPLRDYLGLLRGSHILLDQAYSYTPATNALQAMAMGRVAVSGGEDDFYDFIGEKDNRPIINALPDVEALTAAIEDAVLHPGRLAEMGARSREFVEHHNEAETVARRFVDFWGEKLGQQFTCQ